MLAGLERSNLFLIALDNERRWFRYHHLFRDLLRFRLEAEATADAMKQLHRRASDWFAAQGLVEEAVRHAMQAGEAQRAAAIIEASFHRLFDQSPTYMTTSPLLSMLPPELLTERPMLLVIEAYRHYEHGISRPSPGCTAQAQQHVEHDGARLDAGDLESLRGDLSLLGAMVLFWTGRTDGAVALLERSLRRFLRRTGTPTAWRWAISRRHAQIRAICLPGCG